MSPRKRIPSGNTFLEPPNNKQVIAFLISTIRRTVSHPSLENEAAQDLSKINNAPTVP